MPENNITAELRAYGKYIYPEGSVYWGNIFGDTKERNSRSGHYPNGWPDNHQMHTSLVKSEKDMGDHILVTTLNSVYKLMKDQSLQALINKKGSKNADAGEGLSSKASV